ncbi:hypothetical protein D3C86_1164750 [compost metagenome]
MIAAGDQRRETLVEGRQISLHRSRRDPHQDLADFYAVRIDRGLDVEHRRIVLRRIQHLVQRTLALAFFQQRLVDRVFPIEVARQVLAGGVVIHHEQHIGIALGPAGELGKCRNVVVPHGAGRDGSQKLRHVAGGVLQVLFQGRTQLRLLLLKTRGQTGGQALTRTGRETVEARCDFASRLLKLSGKLLTVRAQAQAQIGFQRGHRAPGQSDSYQHLHQKGDTKGNEHGPQQTAL